LTGFRAASFRRTEPRHPNFAALQATHPGSTDADARRAWAFTVAANQAARRIGLTAIVGKNYI
jgi:hypothetical protein